MNITRLPSYLQTLDLLVGFSVNGINNVNAPMYERRFRLTSTQTGLISSFYDLMGCVTVSDYKDLLGCIAVRDTMLAIVLQ